MNNSGLLIARVREFGLIRSVTPWLTASKFIQKQGHEKSRAISVVSIHQRMFSNQLPVSRIVNFTDESTLVGCIGQKGVRRRRR